MSLSNVTVQNVVKEQVRYKLSAYSGVYLSLVVLQLLGLLFSFNGSGMSGGGRGESFRYSIYHYTGDGVITFTLLWAFIVSIIITTRAYRNDDFTFVSNRLTSNLSNFLFLVLAAIIGAITAELSTYVLKVIMYFLPNFGPFYYTGNPYSLLVLLQGSMVTFLYIMLFAGLGYFVGTIIRLHPLLKVVVPVVLLGVLFFGGATGTGVPDIIKFFVEERSLTIFIAKSIATSFILFGASSWIFNRVEVRQ
ncbi:hypothetical protein FIU87_10105 [Bacillus sp. THAF10]|nr:hypothetical protein FIU87_10105 [Bacillus sp. THAF10]